ncbi:MAG TPA: hypothetical protein P5247_03080, partial [Candidatus Saccharimonadales bacterium]|nr:hypothetical protein [Candidatus Saccharimonadales bacterium]
RATNRDKRRLDDRGSVQLTEDEFTEQSKNFKKPDLKNESFVVISGKHDFKSQSVIVLKKIASMYMNNLNNNSSSSSSISSTRTVLR